MNARWMAPVIVSGIAELFDVQIPVAILSQKERQGLNPRKFSMGSLDKNRLLQST